MANDVKPFIPSDPTRITIITHGGMKPYKHGHVSKTDEGVPCYKEDNCPVCQEFEKNELSYYKRQFNIEVIFFFIFYFLFGCIFLIAKNSNDFVGEIMAIMLTMCFLTTFSKIFLRIKKKISEIKKREK